MWYPSAGQALEDRDDLGMVADRGGDEPRPIRQRPRLARDLEDRRRRVLLDGRHRVGRPAEAAHLGAAPRDLDQELVGELGLGREDRGVGHLELGSDVLARHRLLDDDLAVLGRLGARALHGRHEEAGHLRRRGEEAVAVEARHQKLREPRHEALAVAESEGVDEGRQRRRVHPRDVASDEKDRVPLVPRLAPHGNARLLQRAQDVDDVHLPRRGPGEQAELGERRPGFEGDRGLALLVKEPLADDVGDTVEEAIHPLEAEVRHADFVGVREADGEPVRAEAVGLFGEALLRGALAGGRCLRHAKQRIIGASGAFPPVQRRSKKTQSPTFVPVGPVTNRSPSAAKRRRVSCRSSVFAGESPEASARDTVVPSAKAPAAPELPSWPSEPAASKSTERSPSSSRAAESASSRQRPPRPRAPASATVVSPPARRTEPARRFLARRASLRPARPASPESRRVSRTGVHPALAGLARRGLEAGSVGTHDAHEISPATTDGRPRTDESGAIAGNVGKDQRDEPRRRRPSQAPALDRRELCPETIESVDGSARSSELPDQTSFLRQRHALARHREKRGRSAGEETEDRVFTPEAPEEPERSPPRSQARSVGLRMRGERDGAPRQTARGMSAGEHDERRRAGTEMGQGRARHPGGRLPRREEPDPAAGLEGAPHRGLRERARHGGLRIRAREGGPMERFEETASADVLHRQAD